MSRLDLQFLGFAGKPEGWGRVVPGAGEDGERGNTNAFLSLQFRLRRAGFIEWCPIGLCYRLTAAGRVELGRLRLIWSANGGLGPVGAELERLVGPVPYSASERRKARAA